MKPSLKPIAILMGLLSTGLISPLAMAADSSSTDVDAMVKQINAQTQALEKQVTQLKQEVKRLKAEKSKPVQAAPVAPAPEAVAAEKTVSPVLKMGTGPVVIAPYIGVPSEYDSSDLLIYQSTYKLDQTMLQRNLLLQQTAAKEGITLPSTPALILSGKIESQVYGSKTYSGPNTSDINLTGAELLAAVHVNNWVTGLLTFNYNDAPPSENGGNQQRVSNSSLSIDQAFATIGNLAISPFYATLGQRTIPFGHYSTYMVSDTMPKVLFKLLERSVLFGYDDESTGAVRPYGNVFVFKDDTNAGGGGNNINNYGSNLGLRFKSANGVKSDVGVSGVANVADSNGMQSTGLSTFQGFGYNITQANGNVVNGEDLDRRVPGFNAYAEVANDLLYWNAEFSGATSSFTADNLTYNNHGAKPSAVHTEAAYMFNLGNFPANVAIGYDHTWQALALNVPQQRYIMALNVSFIRNTILSLEFNRWINYAAGDTATGMNSPVIQPTGHYQNNATLQFGVYF